MLNVPLFAADPVPDFLWAGVFLAFAVLLGFSTLMLLVTRYKRCRSDQVLVIFGKVGGGKTWRCIHGGAAFVWPLIQDHAYVSLNPIRTEAALRGAASAEPDVRVNVSAVFQVAVGTEPETLENAVVCLLGLSPEEVKQLADEILIRQVGSVIASLPAVEISPSGDRFLQALQASLGPELKKIGLVLITVQVADVTAESSPEAVGGRRPPPGAGHVAITPDTGSTSHA